MGASRRAAQRRRGASAAPNAAKSGGGDLRGGNVVATSLGRLAGRTRLCSPRMTHPRGERAVGTEAEAWCQAGPRGGLGQAGWRKAGK